MLLHTLKEWSKTGSTRAEENLGTEIHQLLFTPTIQNQKLKHREGVLCKSYCNLWLVSGTWHRFLIILHHRKLQRSVILDIS